MKGDMDDECNRTVCKNKGAVWFNHSTKKFYCSECAWIINDANKKEAMRIFGHELCTLVPK